MTNRYQAIVLAAGRGARFGGGKLTAAWKGRPLILAAVESALASGVDEVVVVLGHDAEQVADALSPIATSSLRTVIASEWSEGLAASLRTGVRSLPQRSDGFLLFLGDMPRIPRELPGRILSALDGGAVAAQPWCDGVPAHPVGFSQSLYGLLLHLEGDAGPRSILDRSDGVVRLAVDDPNAVFDVDRVCDL